MTAHPGTILIADDEPHVVYVVKFKLENAGYNVITSNNGKLAYILACEHLPDLIVTDFQMPGGSGLELATRLTANAETADIPIIMVTARGHRITPTELAETNIKQVMAKPFSPRELISHLNELLQVNRSDESGAEAA